MKFVELLPETKSEKRMTIEWVPAAEPLAPLSGALTITGKRCHQMYLVEEFPADFAGRAFVLKKSDGTGFYSAFVGAGAERLCDCMGATATGRCKHLAALEVLIAAEQI